MVPACSSREGRAIIAPPGGTTVLGSFPTHSPLAQDAHPLSGSSALALLSCEVAGDGAGRAADLAGAPCTTVKVWMLKQSPDEGQGACLTQVSQPSVFFPGSIVSLIDWRWLGKSLLNIHLADGR